MSNGGAVGGAVAGAAAAAIANAIKASGVVVRVNPDDFQSLLARAKEALVVHGTGGLFSTKYRYLVGYRGFAFYTQSSQPIQLPAHVETIRVAKIWAPD